MKKILKKALIIIAIITAIIVLPNISYYYRCYVISQEKLPQEFENYAEIGEIKNEKDFNIKVINGDRSTSKYKLNDSSIVFAGITYNKKARWYKIQTNGKIDSLTKLSEENEFETSNGYIINTKSNFYYTWILDEDSAQKPIIPFKIDKKISEKDLYSFLEATDYATYGKNELDENIKKYIFLKNNKWFYFYSSHDMIMQMPYKDDSFPVLNFDNIEKNINTIHLDYFLKESTTGNFWDSRNFSFGGGGGGGSNRSVFWGNAYYHIDFAGKKFKFLRSFLSVDYEGNIVEDYRKEMSIYVPKSKKYFVIDAYSNHIYYVVTPKNQEIIK